MNLKKAFFVLNLVGAIVTTSFTPYAFKKYRLCDPKVSSICTGAYQTYTDYDKSNLPNYRKIVIEHAEELSQEEIEALKDYETVDLVFDVTRLLKNNKKRLDVSFLKGSNIKINYDSFSWMPDELSKAILLTFLENEDETMFRESFNYRKAKEIDYKLQEFSKNVNIEELDSETQRLEKITQAIMDKITYDYDADGEENVYKGKKYNNNCLSQILLGDGTQEGICDNYASLATILGYMNEIDLEYFSGFIEYSSDYSYTIGHSWNAVVRDDSYEWIDFTLIDQYNEVYNGEYDNEFQEYDFSKYDTYSELIDPFYYEYIELYNYNNKLALEANDKVEPRVHKKELRGDINSSFINNGQRMVALISSLMLLAASISLVYQTTKAGKELLKEHKSKGRK